jgi:xanthine dehydrogenase accessory factor
MLRARQVFAGWEREGKQVAMATVVGATGSAPRPVGSRLFVSSAGDTVGSVSNGCVEGDVCLHARAVLDSGTPRLVAYDIEDDEAFAVGLSCGGAIEVFVERRPTILDAAVGLVEAGRSGTLLTVVYGPSMGSHSLIDGDGILVEGDMPSLMASSVREGALGFLARGLSRTVPCGESRVFAEALEPPPRLVIFGAGAIAETLTALSARVGFEVIVCDARPAFARPERFPEAEEVILGWPDEIVSRLSLDSRTFCVILAHDQRVEGPLLPLLLRSRVCHIAALGSRGTHARRLERLAADGWAEQDTSRILGPAGLDLGAVTAEEIAVAILAELVAVRRGATQALRRACD